MSTVPSKPTTAVPFSVVRPGISDEWHENAAELAAWTMERLVNRRDTFGHYKPLGKRKGEKDTAFTDHSGITLDLLERHYRGDDQGEIIGLHSTAREVATGEGEVEACWSKWGGIDFDCHDEGDDPVANLRAVIFRYDRLIKLGFHPLLEDSDGRGGYHLILIFNAPVPTEDVFLFMKWLNEGWNFEGIVEPETFPKQATLKGKGFGNWLRLPGRHHTRDHWSRVWNGFRWIEGNDAIGFMLAIKGDRRELIPREALDPSARMFSSKTSGGGLKAKSPSLRSDEELAEEALGYLGHMASDYKLWLEVGMCLHKLGLAGLMIWDQWSKGATDKYQAGACQEKWATFTSGQPGQVGLGTLFNHAKNVGWPGFARKDGTESNGGKWSKSSGNDYQKNGSNSSDASKTGALASEDEYASATEAELGIIDAADVTLENPEWLWDRRFLKGKLNLIAGEGGDGKTTVAIMVGSIVTIGGTFPDGTPSGPPGVVMILAAEDGAGDTIKPRFIAAGADISFGKLKFLTAAVNIPKRGDRPAMVHPVVLKDTAYWRAVFRCYRPTLLIIDPLPAYLGKGVNDNRNADVQDALKEFIRVAAEFSVCVIAITHTGKATDRKLIHKILGSVAYTNVARVVHVTLRDPSNPTARYLERPKCNLDEPADALAYKLVSVEFEQDGAIYKTSRAEFAPDPVAIDAEAMANPKRDKGSTRGPDSVKSDKMAQWLFDQLSSGGKRVSVLVNAAQFDKFLPVQQEGKPKPSISPLYAAKDRLPFLKPGWLVNSEEQDGRKFWSLVQTRQTDEHPF